MTATSEPDATAISDPKPTVIRLVAAAAVLLGGLVHLELYFSGYRDIPTIGPSFALQGIASVVVAAVLAVRRDAVVRLAGAALAASTLVALAMSRTDRGVFGFQERGWEPSPQTTLTVIAESVVLVAVAATFWPVIGAGRPLRPRLAAPIVAAIALLSIGAATAWAGTGSPDATEVAAPTTTAGTSAPTAAEPGDPTGEPVVVSIVDFEFDDPNLEIQTGTTVRWVNDDSFAHTVEADDGSFVSERIEPGDVFEFVFETAGQFDYICGLHPTMTATVSVVG